MRVEQEDARAAPAVDAASSTEVGHARRGWTIAATALVIAGVVVAIITELTQGPRWLVATAFTCVGASCLIVAALVLLDARRRRENPVLAVGRAVWAVIRWIFRMVP